MQFVFLLVCLIKSQSTLAGLRIYGGRDANKDEFPYAVAIRYQVKETYENGEIKTNYIAHCSGALLSPTWSLTAAHCIGPNFNKKLKNFPQNKKLVLANQDLSKISEIKWGIMHPLVKFVVLFPLSTDYDIGLLHSEPMVLKQYAKLSPLQYTSLTGFEATLVGYGLNETLPEDPVPYYNTTLKVLKTVIMRCPKKITSSMRSLCLSHACADVGVVCGGDSGGPVVHASGVVGVTSLGNPVCDVTDEKIKYLRDTLIGAGVAIPISPHIDWILRIITDHNNNM